MIRPDPIPAAPAQPPRKPGFLRREDGTTMVEFVLTLPLVLAFLLSAVDLGVLMLRQVFLDRAVDMATREIRLGNVTGDGLEQFRTLVCNGTLMIADCTNSTAIELRPIDPATWAGLNDPALCVDRAEEIAPMLAFNPGAAQDLMLIRVCAVVDPFLNVTGLVLGLPRDASGGYRLVSRAAFTNEP
jgi:Flp pilus assembly protein TadG